MLTGRARFGCAHTDRLPVKDRQHKQCQPINIQQAEKLLYSFPVSMSNDVQRGSNEARPTAVCSKAFPRSSKRPADCRTSVRIILFSYHVQSPQRPRSNDSSSCSCSAALSGPSVFAYLSRAFSTHPPTLQNCQLKPRYGSHKHCGKTCSDASKAAKAASSPQLCVVCRSSLFQSNGAEARLGSAARRSQSLGTLTIVGRTAQHRLV